MTSPGLSPGTNERPSPDVTEIDVTLVTELPEPPVSSIVRGVDA